MKLLRPLIILSFSLFPLLLQAQLGVYGSFSAVKLNVPANNNFLYGGTFGAYLDSNHLAVLNYGLDLRGSVTGGGGTSFDFGSIGPRLGVNLHVIPIHPYIEALAGVGHAGFTQFDTNSVTKFEYQFVGGVDYTILPRIDWRIAEISYGGLGSLNGESFHPKSISTGIVLRLPHSLP
jgi:hypothetical protein